MDEMFMNELIVKYKVDACHFSTLLKWKFSQETKEQVVGFFFWEWTFLECEKIIRYLCICYVGHLMDGLA